MVEISFASAHHQQGNSVYDVSRKLDTSRPFSWDDYGGKWMEHGFLAYPVDLVSNWVLRKSAKYRDFHCTGNGGSGHFFASERVHHFFKEELHAQATFMTVPVSVYEHDSDLSRTYYLYIAIEFWPFSKIDWSRTTLQYYIFPGSDKTPYDDHIGEMFTVSDLNEYRYKALRYYPLFPKAVSCGGLLPLDPGINRIMIPGFRSKFVLSDEDYEKFVAQDFDSWIAFMPVRLDGDSRPPDVISR